MIEVMAYDSGRGADRRVCLSSVGHSKEDVCLKVSTLMDMVAGYMVNLTAHRPDTFKVQLLEGDGMLSLDLIMEKNTAVAHDELDAVMWLLGESFDRIQMYTGFGDLFQYTFMHEMPFDMRLETHIEAVREWRTQRGLDLNDLTLVFPDKG